MVGILGGQGVGKSSLLSSFCQKPNTFTKQPPSMAAVAGYQTSGIDMYITSERMILLDTEPLFCMSNLENALRNERITEGVPPDMWLDHQALVMTTFLLSVCNVVMIVVDENSHWMGTTKVFKLLQRCELMMKALSLSNSGSTVGAGGGVAGGGGGAMGVHATPQEGLGDWCADIGMKKGNCYHSMDCIDPNSFILTFCILFSLLFLYGMSCSIGVEQGPSHEIWCGALSTPSPGAGESVPAQWAANVCVNQHAYHLHTVRGRVQIWDGHFYDFGR